MKYFFLLPLLILLTACGSKVPFKEETTKTGEALVYIYAPQELTDNSEAEHVNKYTIKIGNETINGFISDGEYKVFHLRPSTNVFTITKDAILAKKLTLSVEADKKYFLRILKESDTSFDFEQVPNNQALKEISETELADSFMITEDQLNSSLIKSFTSEKRNESIVYQKEESVKKPAPTPPAAQAVTHTAPKPVLKSNKLEEIKSAYELKKEGAITQEEYEQLKKEILNK
jgi:hypothetical protein